MGSDEPEWMSHVRKCAVEFVGLQIFIFVVGYANRHAFELDDVVPPPKPARSPRRDRKRDINRDLRDQISTKDWSRNNLPVHDSPVVQVQSLEYFALLNLLRSCLAEFFGLSIFIFIGSMSFQLQYGAFSASFAHGFTIALLIIGMGHISGGHFNPAVTLGIAVSGEINPLGAVLYVLSQLSGAFVGALFVRAVLPLETYVAIAGGTTNMNGDVMSIGQAILTEIIITYVLVSTVLNAAVDSGGSNVLAPMGIGLSVLVGILAGGTTSGGSMNPARSFGPAAAYSIFFTDTACVETAPCVSSDMVWATHYVHWVGPAIGALIAAIKYKLFFAKAEKRWIFK